MEINSKKICYKFNDLFKTVDELKNFINKSNKFVNVDVIEDKITLLYNELNVLDLKVKYSVINTFLIERLNFKYKRPNNINFWLERGYGFNEFNDYNVNRKIGNQYGSKHNSVELIKPLSESNINTFKYGKFSYVINNIPKCNLCNNLLDVIPVIGHYKITGCNNNKCETHKNITIDTIRQLGFLPIEMFKEKNKRINIDNKTFKEYWLLKGFTYQDSINKINDIKEKLKSVNKNSFEFYKIISDMSDDEINNKIKSSSKLCVKYWVNKGYGEEESKNEVSKLQIKNAGHLIEHMKNNPSMYSSYTETQIGYWIKKGFNEKESKLKISERQKTFSLNKCIDKYGEIDGIKKYTDRQIKWQKTLNENGNLKIGYSKISQDLFYKLLDIYEICNREYIYFATHNGEYKIKKDNGGIWLYDFVDLKNKKIIEFNGDMYHANPKKYLSEDHPHPFRKNLSSKEIWEKDNKKIKSANEQGFEILIVWDSEYRWGNKQEIINKCINFLKN